MNPFASRTMIKDPEMFSGRIDELKTIKNLLLTMQSCSIVGPRRIGKSSLLFYVSNPAYYKKEYPQEYRFVFLDLQELSGAKTEDFFLTIIDRLKRMAPEMGLADSEKDATLTGFRRLLGRLTDAGLKLVLCLDEFEMLSQNTNFSAEFFTFLRGLCSNYNFILLTSSRRSLFDLCHQRDIQTSQLWNIFVELPLGLMNSEEAQQLIKTYFERGKMPVSAKYNETTLALAGNHPFFLQIAFYYLYDVCEHHPEPDLIIVHNMFSMEAKRHYIYAWDQLEDAHKQILFKITRQPNRVEPSAFQFLKRETLLHGTADRPEFTSVGLKEFVVSQNKEDLTVASIDVPKTSPRRKTEILNYLDFDLLIEEISGAYRARVLNSPSGQATTSFVLPFQDLELENFFLRIGRPRRSTRRIESAEVDAIKDFGMKLFNSVFKEDVMQSLRGSLDEAYRQGAGLRLRLRLRDAPKLMDLPWEFLYNQSLNRFLSLSLESPIVRFLDLPESIRPLRISPPVRILFVISNAKDYMQLDVNQEWEKINTALGELIQKKQIEIDLLTNPTQTRLLRALRNTEYHILHFVGHGGFDGKSEEGVLILEDEHGNGFPVAGSRIGTMLHDERTLRLVILNACEGARTSVNDPFAGVAQTIVQQGVPAVIAMQFEITDEAAIAFSHSFYSILADGFPVDAALTEARKEIFANGNDVEWGTPVLYLRAPDGKIFEFE